MSAGEIDGAIARAVTIGLVLVRHGVPVWLNPAAERLVDVHGGAWTGPGSPLDTLADVRPGSRTTPTRWPSPAGGTRWWQVDATPMDGGVLYEITDHTDQTEEDGRDTGPPTAQWRLARLEALTGQGSWVWNLVDGTVEFSEALAEMFGLEAGVGLDAGYYRALYHPDDAERVFALLNKAVRTGEPFSYVSRAFLERERRRERVFECHGEVFRDAGGRTTRVMGTLRDITAQHRDRVELAYLAEHDPLTGVANRRRINAWLADSAAGRRGAALLMIDIDNFKDINDLRGHAVGDDVIRGVAALIGGQIGSSAVLGRLGGDEFAVLVPDRTAMEALALAEELRAAVAGAELAVQVPRVTVSVGVAVVEAGQPADAALGRADLALYAAKSAGRNRVRLYSADQYHDAARRVSLLERVAAALKDETMALDAQPIIDLASNRITRYEVLVRLRDGVAPQLGPAEFLPAIERTDLVLELDRWVLRRAVATLAKADGLRLEVNLSARSLDAADLGPWVLDLLGAAGVGPERLGLEITETAALSSLKAAQSLATLLIGAGCGLALDDFGAGYGSFTYLKHLPLTTVKIAGEFVRQLDENAVDRAMVAGVVGVARRIGMRTVAEEVARPSLVHHLRALGVDDGQGFFLGRPRPITLLLPGAEGGP